MNSSASLRLNCRLNLPKQPDADRAANSVSSRGLISTVDTRDSLKRETGMSTPVQAEAGRFGQNTVRL